MNISGNQPVSSNITIDGYCIDVANIAKYINIFQHLEGGSYFHVF